MASFANPSSLWQPFGAFSQLAWPGPGQLLFLKGQVALDRDGRLVGAGDMAAQVRQVLSNVRGLLEAVGGRLADILSLTQHTTDIEAFMAAGAVRKEFFSPPYPVTTTVEVRRLYRADVLIEITAIAEIPHERFRPPAGGDQR